MRFKVANYSRLRDSLRYSTYLHQPPTKFEVRRRHTFGFSINQPGDLDLWVLWPLTSNLVRVIARRVGNSLSILVFLGLFILDLWANNWANKLTTAKWSTWPCDLDLWGFDLALGVMALVHDTGLRAPMYTKFEVHRPFLRKILRIYCVSINRPGDFDLWPCDL